MPWSGTRDATAFGPVAPQSFGFGRSGRMRGAEDCLTLNIWSPAGEARSRPVMVWIHGGAFVSGSGAHYNGSKLASRGDIVVVTLNYRLGVLGFCNLGDALDDPSVGSNLGVRDVLAALRWVKTNIAAFGGDPDAVTIAGESAGSIIVSLLLLADTAPLIHRAIMQSGSFNLAHSRERSTRNARAYLDHLGARNLSDLQNLPTEALLQAQTTVARRMEGTSRGAPWFDGALLPASYADASARPLPPIPLLAGANRDEINLFKVLPGPRVLRTSRAALTEIVTRDLDPESASRISTAYPDTRAGNRALGSHLNFGMPTLHFAERQAGAGIPVWTYRFDYAHPVLGAYHALDLLFLWPFPGLLGASLRGGFLTGRRSGLSERMRSAWASFVRTGSPGEDWPRFTLPERSTRLFDLQDRMIDDPMRDKRVAWQGQDTWPGR